MASPLFDLMNGNSMMQKFSEFKRTFSGNPQEEVQKLLNTGKMSQQQYNQLCNMANNMRHLFK